ncbi:MAG TPA: glycoside hydrolase family 95 protein [Bacteroidales bacterium]|nr:glycoside hydrolase family 95 protein [Bacteroidales bacterium]
MKVFLKTFLLAAVLITMYAFAGCRHSDTKQKPLRIWYDKPALSGIADLKEGWRNDPEWLKALPVGNGSTGAMVFGDVNKERIQLNDKNLWSGSPDDNDNPEARASLDKIRQLLFDGRYKEATDLTMKTQVCKGAGSGQGNGADASYGCYQTLGDLWLDFGKNTPYENYHRELDLDNGIVKVSYTQDGIRYEREVFVSYPDKALVIHIKSDKKGAISFTGMLTRPERFKTQADNSSLLMTGTLSNGKGGEGMKYDARLKVMNDRGDVAYNDTAVIVRNTDAVTLLLTSSTDYKQEYPDYKGDDPVNTTLQLLEKASGKDYKTILSDHLADYRKISGRVSLELTQTDPDTIPTDRRLAQQNDNPDDLLLQQIYFQYGRYLLISSSREGSLPANLQGIWANKIQTPWNCDYHTDINVQMNYWPADITNLGECHSPLTELIMSLVKPGERTASVQYQAKGWCIHPITNVWGFTAPGEHPSWGMHVGAGGWLCQHLWDHYQFTLDTAYLRKVYPVMVGSAQFYLDWLVRDPATGLLVSGPASSPENSFIAPDGTVTQITMGPSHDQEVIHELFTNILAASKVLGDNDSLLPQIETALKELAMPGIGSDGRLMEWREEFKETEPTHRHVSHLYMLHPGNVIDPARTPELAAAARKSLEVRTDIGTGWSLAWKVNFWARLKDGERAYTLLKDVLRPAGNYGINMSDAGGTFPNLFCAHPPYQIDGNFGAASGIAEMLLQSHLKDGDSYVIQLLPALPAAWKEGEVKGLRTRGACEADIKWKGGKLAGAELISEKGGNYTVEYKGKAMKAILKSGERINISERSFGAE